MRLPPARSSSGTLPSALLVALSTLATALSGCAAPEADAGRPEVHQSDGARDTPRLPRPVDRALEDEDRESEGRREREAWIERLHGAAPGTDWRAIERDNARAQAARRAELARAPQSSSLAQWSERGSDNQSGNVKGAARSTDGQGLYVGSALGGLWRGDLDGNGWTPLSDEVYGGAHHVAVVSALLPGGPDVLLQASDGGLVFASYDDGVTWTPPAGLPTDGSLVRRVRVSSDGLETVYLLLRSGGLKLYRSLDGALSFEEVFNLGFGADGDVWVPRDGGGAVYLLGAGKLRKSLDQGDTWSDQGNLPIASTSGELSGCEVGATPRLYCMIPFGGNSLYRSDDEGASWTLLQTNVSDYWGQFAVSSVDPDLLAYGGVECWVSRDGGLSFGQVNGWAEYYGDPATKLHADIMSLDVVVDGPGLETWYVSTHGGLYRSQDALASVENLALEGLRVSQYYSTHTSSADTDHLLAGTQDQGYQLSNAATTEGVLDLSQPISGDYGHLVSGDGDHDFVYSVYPGFVLIDRVEGSAGISTADFPSGETNAWLPPLAGDPLDDTAFFWCGTSIWRYTKGTGNSWSPTVWTSGPVSTSLNDYVSALAFSPLDVNRAYCATNSGKLFWSDDRGQTWTESVSTGPPPHYFYGNAIVASSRDVDTVWIGGSGYSGPAIFRSTDGGQTFAAWDEGLPDTLVYSLVEEPGAVGAVYCGTETSAYRRAPEDAAWVDVTGGIAPATIYWSAEAVPGTNTIRFGTYGRGIWDYTHAPAPEALVYGCGGNPAGSLTVGQGLPTPGASMAVVLDDPTGNTAFGALSYVLFSFAPDPAYPCGTLVPNLGLAGGPGELLIGVLPPDPQALVSGSPWLGVGLGAVVPFDVPEDDSLLGVSVFGQGLLFDVNGSAPRWGLTEGLELRIGL